VPRDRSRAAEGEIGRLEVIGATSSCAVSSSIAAASEQKLPAICRAHHPLRRGFIMGRVRPGSVLGFKILNASSGFVVSFLIPWAFSWEAFAAVLPSEDEVPGRSRGEAGAQSPTPELGFAQLRAAMSGKSYRVEPTPPDLQNRFSASQIELLEKLNRADRMHLSRLDHLVVPNRWDLDELEYAPFPREVVELARHPKALVVHQPLQVFGGYEHGRLVRWGPVSSGRREHPTPSGAFNLNWRSRGRHSTVNPSWYMEWYFNFHNTRGLALHQYAMPGRPASHACIRLLERDARWLYIWGEGWKLDARGWAARTPGTPLWIIESYDFEASPPWLEESEPHPSVTIRIPD
jgi:hypothetical protein